MRNFPTEIWKRFQDAKDLPAFVYVDDEGQRTSETYWEWTRRVQRIAMGLMDRGFKAGTRVGMIIPNSRAWLDVAHAVWLVGGCVVPLVPDRDRRETLRCLARSGCGWIVTQDMEGRSRLRGQGGSLPEHLRWLVVDKPDGEPPEDVATLKGLEESGRSRLLRGGINQLAERTYGLEPTAPALILFDPEPGEDPQGAFFNGRKVGRMLEYLSHDLALEDEARLAVILSFGWFSAALAAFTALWSGRSLLIADSLSNLQANFATLQPTHIVCGPAYLEGQASRWLDKIERAPEFLKKMADLGDESASGAGAALDRALGLIGERAARKLFYEPLVADFGGRLEAIHVWGGRVPDPVHRIFENARIELLGFYGFPECGISHTERPGARRRHSVGRPVEGYVCKIAGAKAEGTGEILIRSEVLFDGYWTGKGPRHVEDGWLHTGVAGRIESGYLFLE